MKKHYIVLLVLFVLCSIPVYADEAKDVPAAKEEATASIPPEGTAGPDNATTTLVLSGFNRYVFRGYEISSHSLVLQPSIAVAYKGFSAKFWGNLDTNETATQSFVPNNPGNKSYNETDITLSYTRSWGIFSLTGGYVYYGVQYAKQTQELFVAGAFDVITKPVLSIYRDIDGYPGTYFNLAFSHSIPIPKVEGMTVDLGASFGYMAGSSNYWRTYEISPSVEGGIGDYTGSKYSAFHDGMLMTGLTIPITKSMSAQPVVMYTFPLSSQAGRGVDGVSYNPNGAIDSTVTYGLNLTYNF
ncbi:MAG: hypothetical protein HQK88_07640 [Nitrospirae bacterium]|nr:hypothetical protein [Nitrospirota bacterium]MBF0521280.1 hypothetical protein [Nitrospirota bacterium]MBF0533674.1 hypothetical protein [Nitrospirota bacterium]MBF0616675.1 hypothetical protein [Nitrospirota bacterium]